MHPFFLPFILVSVPVVAVYLLTVKPWLLSGEVVERHYEPNRWVLFLKKRGKVFAVEVTQDDYEGAEIGAWFFVKRGVLSGERSHHMQVKEV